MKNYHTYILETVGSLSKNQIFAEAELYGTALSPCINGATVFYRHHNKVGIFVVSTVFGLPDDSMLSCYEMHVKGGYRPVRTLQNAPKNDLRRNMLMLPDIKGNGGFAFSMFYTEEISPLELLGRTVSVFPKSSRSFYHSEALACGLILPLGAVN